MDINGTSGNDLLIGTDGDDAIAGLAGDDTLLGGAGNDLLRGYAGNDLMNGGDGHDNLIGGGGENTLMGGAGDDILQAFGARDVLDGGAGFDRAGFFNEPGAVTVDLRIAGPQFNGCEMVTLIGIEHVTGTVFDDRLTGDGGANWIAGRGGNDTLAGMGGDDLLEHDGGNCVVDGGDGTDTLTMSGNGDFTHGVTVSLALQGAPQDTGEGLMTLISVENLSGSQHGDTLTGSDLPPAPGGGDGEDRSGDDDTGDDERRDDGGAASAGHAGHAGNVLAGDLGDDLITGGNGDDTLLGDGVIGIDAHGLGGSGPITTWLVSPDGPGGADTLIGGRGDDVLVGGGGADVLTGGHGADRFVYTSLGDSAPGARDVITDLENKDVIDLSAIDADINLAGDQAFHQVNAFTHHAGELVLDYDKAARMSHLSVDVNGDGQADLVIDILGRATNFHDIVF